MGDIRQIGRFKILRALGAGGQGMVYLAEDSQLERLVAIKTLRARTAADFGALQHEARIVSKLQHPNIVTLYDAGEYQGAPYLVSAYIEGSPLSELLQAGALPLVRAAGIAAALLEGLEYAHAHGVLHLDINPDNVMLAQSGQPMIMDFGIARMADEQPADGNAGLTVSPQYMSPEMRAGRGLDARADLFAVGMVLGEMATGKPVGNAEAVRKRLAAPGGEIDEKLRAIILKSIAELPDERYPDAATMRQAIRDYLGAVHDAALKENESHSTLDFLLRRMRSKGDFPALSGIISEINKIVASESESANKLARVIVQDFALTNKLLRLVNAATYGQFGGNINTISKAVVILGFETVRNIAMSLILLEFMHNKAQAQQLKDEVIAAFFAGMVAAQLAEGNAMQDGEEALICGMFQNLGRLLAKFYFFEESQEVARLVEQRITEDVAAIKVLGVSYNELGLGVARSWNFPKRLLLGMEKLSSGKVRKPRTDTDHIAVIVNLANELCHAAAVTGKQEKGKELAKLCQRYGEALTVSEQRLNKVLENGLDELAARAAKLQFNVAKSPLLQKIRDWSGYGLKLQAVKPDSGEVAEGISRIEAAVSAENGVAPTSEALLSAGIQDVTNALVEEFGLNDILMMVLETMYRALGFKRVLILIRDARTGTMAARAGMGGGVEAVIPRFRFSLNSPGDVFQLAVDKGADIVIENVNAQNIADKIPAWYRQAVDAKSFLLLPVMIKGKAVGVFYADMAEADALHISERELGLLRTLRNQAILAIRNKA
jgi:serine/threonine protein kinase